MSLANVEHSRKFDYEGVEKMTPLRLGVPCGVVRFERLAPLFLSVSLFCFLYSHNLNYLLTRFCCFYLLAKKLCQYEGQCLFVVCLFFPLG